MGNAALGEEPGDGGSDSCTHQMIKNLVLTLHAGEVSRSQPLQARRLPSLFSSVSRLLTLPMKRITFSFAGFGSRCVCQTPGQEGGPLLPVSSVLQAES